MVCNWMKGYSLLHQLMLIREMLEIQTGLKSLFGARQHFLLKLEHVFINTCFLKADTVWFYD